MHRASAIAIGSCILACAANSWADARDPAAAEVLFRQGRQAMEAQNFRDACPRFAESQRLDPGAGTLMNLATCEEKLTKLASAWQHWKEAIDALPAGDDRIPFARGRVTELETRLPRLNVTLAAGAEPGVHVFRDDVELGRVSQGALLPVDPGVHTVTVQWAGHFTEKVTVSVAEAEAKQIEVRPGAVDPASISAKGEVTSAEPRSRTLGFVIGGLGLAAVGTGVVTGFMLASEKNSLMSNCPNKLCTNQSDVDAASSAKTLLVVNTASFIAGGVGLGVGAYLLFFAPHRGSTAVVVPVASADGAALSYAGTF